MEDKKALEFSLWSVIIPVFFGVIIWGVYWFELAAGVSLNKWGIYPRTIEGVPGIVTHALVHSSVSHLYHNTLPLMILSLALFYFYRPVAWKVLGWGLLLSGLFTWIIGRPSWHIGASGVIYMLVSFIFFKGVLARNYRLMALSLAVVFFYGSMVWYVLPVDDKISWEGHLSGAVAGIILSLFFRKQVLRPRRFRWEQPDYREEDDPFMRHFDEEGNFIEKLPEEDSEEGPDEVTYTYNYTERDRKLK